MNEETRRRDCAELGEMRSDLLALGFTTDSAEDMVRAWWESRLRLTEILAEEVD